MTQPNPGGGYFFSVTSFLRQYRIFRHPGDLSMEPTPARTEATDFGKLVIDALTGMTQRNNAIDQRVLRMYLSLAPSYLVLDSSMNTAGGIASWNRGFQRLVDVLMAIHKRGELELETVNEASRACAECWVIAKNWRGLDECREYIREIAGKLKTLLDENGRTFQGNPVYAP